MALFGVTAFTPIAQEGVWSVVSVQVLAVAASSVSFSGLSGSPLYQVMGHILKDSSTGNPTALLRMNNDSGSNYSAGRILQNNTTRAATAVASQSSIPTVSTMEAGGGNSFLAWIGKVASGVRGQVYGAHGFQQATGAYVSERSAGEWNNTAATISRIDVLLSTNNMAAGTSIRLDQKVIP